MKGIRPIGAATREASQAVYTKLLADPGRWIADKLKYRGIHTLIHSRLAGELAGADVLDVGCGYGRFALLAARSGARALGIDRSESAVGVARTLARATGLGNVEFEIAEAEDDARDDRFDHVVMASVLEQLVEPERAVAAIARRLAPGGRLVISSSNESNFRGDVAQALGRLLGFTVTMADLRVVTPEYVDELARAHGFRVEEVLGCCYQRAWGGLGADDLQRRIDGVLLDVGEGLSAPRLDKPGFDSWVERRASEHAALLDDWRTRGWLQPLPGREPLALDEGVLREAGLPVRAIQDYLAPDFSLDPDWCEVAPYNALGGQIVYLLRRL